MWDMDGTLIDSEPLWLEAELEMLRRYGVEMTPDTHRRLIGSGLWEAAEHFRELGVPLSADDIVAEWVRGVSEGAAQQGLSWRPGARELLASLAAHGITSVLVTMSVRSFAEQVTSELPANSFAAIVAGDEVRHPKPHPEPYLLGARAAGAPIERCLAIEDSPTGLRAAVASGAVAIGVPNLIGLEGERAHGIWDSLLGVDAAGLRDRFSALRSIHFSS
nr:HAD family phosphatase [Leucobacter weissii]